MVELVGSRKMRDENHCFVSMLGEEYLAAPGVMGVKAECMYGLVLNTILFIQNVSLLKCLYSWQKTSFVT